MGCVRARRFRQGPELVRQPQAPSLDYMKTMGPLSQPGLDNVNRPGHAMIKPRARSISSDRRAGRGHERARRGPTMGFDFVQGYQVGRPQPLAWPDRPNRPNGRSQRGSPGSSPRETGDTRSAPAHRPRAPRGDHTRHAVELRARIDAVKQPRLVAEPGRLALELPVEGAAGGVVSSPEA